MKDVPFFPYAPYIPQTEMSVTGASFSQKHVQLPPVEEEDEREEAEERVEDNERVWSPSVLAVLITPFILAPPQPLRPCMSSGNQLPHDFVKQMACTDGEYMYYNASCVGMHPILANLTSRCSK